MGFSWAMLVSGRVGHIPRLCFCSRFFDMIGMNRLLYYDEGFSEDGELGNGI